MRAQRDHPVKPGFGTTLSFCHHTPWRAASRRAAGTGSLDAARMLVEHGSAKVDAKDKLGETPLALACRSNHRAVALYLVHKGADVEVRSRQSRLGAYTHCNAWSRGLRFTGQVPRISLQPRLQADDVDGETPLGLAAPFAHLRQDLADLALKKKTIQDFGLH